MEEAPEKLVVNTNVLVAFIKTRGLTRKIILNEVIELYTVEDVIDELKEKQVEWSRGQLSKDEVERLLDLINHFVLVLPRNEYKPQLSRAYRIMKDIDEDDSPVLAAALKLRCGIWSNDRHFKSQRIVPVYSTQELVGW